MVATWEGFLPHSSRYVCSRSVSYTELRAASLRLPARRLDMAAARFETSVTFSLDPKHPVPYLVPPVEGKGFFGCFSIPNIHQSHAVREILDSCAFPSRGKASLAKCSWVIRQEESESNGLTVLEDGRLGCFLLVSVFLCDTSAFGGFG